jgi:GGDEF domain-containing protein
MRLPAEARSALARAGAQSGVVSPLLYRDIALGSDHAAVTQARVFGEIELDSFTAIGNTVALALASARHVDGLEYLAHHDSLTGLPNRMFLHREFAQRWRAATDAPARRCCCSTSTASRRSTTPSATTSATSCCSRSARG